MSIQLVNLTIEKHEQLNLHTYFMTLTGADFSSCHYGQFINIQVEGAYLRRPISICQFDKDTLSICYRVIGDGTKRLSTYAVGDQLSCLIGLGTGFTLPPNGVQHVTLVGGGIGVPPLVGWYQYLKENTTLTIDVVLGFANQQEIILASSFENPTIMLNTENKTVLDGISQTETYMYSCGPSAMLHALAQKYQDGQMLLEARMGCGFGACMGCSKVTSDTTYKRVCVEGPMFLHEEVRYGLERSTR